MKLQIMIVAGFTFIRNAIQYDYPIVEAIQSILPICNYVVVAIGNSDDGTLDLIKSIDNQKIRIIETIWDDSLKEDGKVLAIETNKAFDAIPNDADWCFYIQGDEVLPEFYHDIIKEALIKYENDVSTEGFLFNYRHFYGSYDYIGISRGWYRREIRIIKNDKSIRSYRDAQGFRKNGRKLKVRLLDEVYIHHYGWVRHPQAQQLKQLNFNRYWFSKEVIQQRISDVDFFDYESQISGLVKFEGQHPVVMQPRIDAINWHFKYDPRFRKFNLKEKLSEIVEKLTGWRVGEYKNYILISTA
jgi:hypothetical protein